MRDFRHVLAGSAVTRDGAKRAARITALGLALAAGAAGAAATPTVSLEAPKADKALTEALKAASLALGTLTGGDSQAQDLFAAARSDYRRLLGALYAAGFYAPVIHILVDGREAAGIAPLDAPNQIGAIREIVDPGPPYRFGRVAIAPLAPGTKLPPAFAPGQPAASGAIQAAIDAAVAAWKDAGHAKVKLAGQNVLADGKTDTVDAQIALDPGPVVTLGPLSVSGSSQVRESRIEAIAGFPTGKVYSPQRVQDAADRLRRTGAFTSVALTEADTLGPDNTLAYSVAVVDQKKRRLGFGAELSSSAGANLSAFWLHRNLFGGAEQFRLSGEVDGLAGQTGGRSYKLTARLDRSATFSANSALYLLGTIERQNLTDYSANVLSFSTGLTRRVNNRTSFSYGIGYDSERVTDAAGTTSYRDLTLPLTGLYDSRNDKLDARRGLYLDLGLMPFLGFGGTGTGAKLTFDARDYVALSPSIVLAGRLQGGSILGAALAATPRNYLFYSGGGGTVRGQPYQSLGVYALGNGVRSGGRSFLGLSGELRARLNQSFGLVAFYDAGFVGAGSFGAQGAWQAGAGLGLRYFTGIGPIRLDAALPVGGGTGKGLQLYIGIGQAF